VDWSLLTKDVQPEYHHDLNYPISMLEWEANVNSEFAKTNKALPKPVRPVAEMKDQGYGETTQDELFVTADAAHKGPQIPMRNRCGRKTNKR